MNTSPSPSSASNGAAANGASGSPDSILQWMDGLADSTRLRLLCLLERQELGVVDLCDVLQMPQSTVSRHLKVLSDQGWLQSRRQGTGNLYSVAQDDLAPAARSLWELTRKETKDWPTLRQDAVRLERRLSARSHDSKAFFAGAAANWLKLRQELYGSNFSTAAMLALLPAEWTVADLGCGTGQMVSLLASNVAQVIGVDSSPEMLAAAKKRLRAHANVDLREGDLEGLPIEDAACDAALMVLVLTYVVDPAVALAEMMRVIRPGGRAVVVDLMLHDRDDFRRQMDQKHMGFAADTLAAMLLEVGFENATVRSLSPEEDAKGPALLLATAMKPAQ